MKLLLLFIILSIKTVFADQPRLKYSFKSKNEFFELRPSDTIFSDKKVYSDSIYDFKTKTYAVYNYSYSNRYHWSVYDLRTNKKVYTIKKEFLSIETKTAIISENGKNIIIIDDFGGGFGDPDLKVVHFFEKEKLIKTLTLGYLLDNMCSITYSMSHMRWCFSFNLEKNNTLQLKTYEYYHYKFDLKGNLIEKKSDSRIKERDDILTTKIKRIEKDKYSFIIKKSIRNKYQPKTELIINVPDRQMRKIHGKFYGFLPSKNKKMKAGFYGTVLFRNNQPIYSKIDFPNYNGNDFCNIVNQEHYK